MEEISAIQRGREDIIVSDNSKRILDMQSGFSGMTQYAKNIVCGRRRDKIFSCVCTLQ
jgi:hypothetical protein